MEFKQIHEHPLILEDLQSMYQDYEEDDYECDDEDLIAIQNFKRTCGMCGLGIDWYHRYHYKCDTCHYSLHKFCAEVSTSFRFSAHPLHTLLLKKGSNSWSCHACFTEHEHGIGKTSINYDVADYPDLLHYPLLDESCILPHQVLKRKKYPQITEFEFGNRFVTPFDHDDYHQLLLINTTDTSISGIQPVFLHDPIKRIKLLCNGCVRPIKTTPFYVCKQVVDGCDFHLHEQCTRLPTVLEDHPGHPQHPLTLFQSLPDNLSFTGFVCQICSLSCNGFGYVCSTCDDYRVDVNCGFIPKNITHEAHPNHLLSLVYPPSIHSTRTTIACHACDITIKSYELCFGCRSCDFYLDNRCALNLPKTIKNKYDKHPLKLSYFPIENHKSQYFCEVCEEELNPEKWFYHCLECGQSIHTACAPLILQSEQDVNSLHHVEGVYMFLNMKLGSVFTFFIHTHPLLLRVGVESDDRCFICEVEVLSSLIFKCLNLNCKLNIHVSCFMKFQKQWSVGLLSFEFKPLSSTWRYKKRLKPKEKVRHQTTHSHATLKFYPNRVMRPVTAYCKADGGAIY